MVAGMWQSDGGRSLPALAALAATDGEGGEHTGDGLRPSLVRGRNVKRAMRLNKDGLDTQDECIAESVVVILGSCWDVRRMERYGFKYCVSSRFGPSHPIHVHVPCEADALPSVGSLQIFAVPGT
jgi:hypothetical protein